jgi:anti-sigma B factor antagonist
MRVHSEQSFTGAGAFSMPSPDLSVVDRTENDVAVIDLAGPLVGERPVHGLHDRIRQLLDLGTQSFAINLAEVPYADSYGLSGLMAAYKLIQGAGGRITFFAAPPRLVDTLTRLRLDTVFELFPDESSALSSF